MKAKFSWIWFSLGIVWLAGVVLSFAYASQTVEVDLQKGLIWFGVSILFGAGGVFGATKLNGRNR